MIKKCISSVLAFLIIINTIGCYATAYVPKNQYDEIAKGDNITVIDEDMKAYNITVESADRNEIHGFYHSGEQKSMVVIRTDQVAMIEIRRMDFGIMILVGSIFLGAIIFEGIIIPIHRP
jgi:hypothetical protein